MSKHKIFLENNKNQAKQLEELYQEIVRHIQSARENVVRSVNHEMVNAYWHIGKRIVEIEQGGERRAEYGGNLLTQLSVRLTQDFGKGFSVTNLKYFRQFYLTYQNRIGHKPCDKSDNPLNPHLSWSHYRALMKVSRTEARAFYEKEAIDNNYYDKEKRREDDNPTIGLVLCTEKNNAMVKYLLNDKNKQIFASQYQFYLPTEQELQEMVQQEVRELEIEFGQVEKTN